MNKQYKLKFNRTTLSLDAVSEIATSCVSGSAVSPKAEGGEGRKFWLSRVNRLLCSLILPITLVGTVTPNVFAYQRSGMTVINGQVQAITDGLVTTITNSPNAIINWEKFNIGTDELVRFVQDNANSAVLNRVIGGDVSNILGQLQSNGKVFIVNPAGIIFGETARVDVASLVASTLDISDEDFINGNYVFNQEKDQALASVLNQGIIKANEDGTLALVGGGSN